MDFRVEYTTKNRYRTDVEYRSSEGTKYLNKQLL